MNTEYLLQQAIQVAKKGYRPRAREMFLQVVENEPKNLIAWLWLIDLFENPEDRIKACQRALELSPTNVKIQAKLDDLTRQWREEQKKPGETVAQQIKQAEHLLEGGEYDQAQALLRKLVETENKNERAWHLLSQLTTDEAQQIAALQQVLAINPGNLQARTRLDQLQHFQENPMDLAARYEEEGKYEEAIAAYRKAAMQIRYGPQFDQIFKNIERLEKHKDSGVVYVRPDQSIARLTFGPPILFLLLMLVHNQLNPFALTPILWLGVLLTLIGGFLVAVANVRSRHMIWEKLFDDPGGGGTPLARLTVSLAGWLLLFISYAYLMQISFERLPLVETNTFLLTP